MTLQDRRSKNESGGAEPYIPYIPLMIEKISLFSKKVGGLSPPPPPQPPMLRRACTLYMTLKAHNHLLIKCQFTLPIEHI